MMILSQASVYGEQVEELRRWQDDGEGLHAYLQQEFIISRP